MINKYQIPYFAHTKLDNIRAKYEGYIKYVSDELDRMPTQSTIANHHAALKLILTEAVSRGWASTDLLPVLKSVGKQTTRRPTFEISEYRSLIQKLKHWSQQKSHRHKDTEIRLMLYDYVLFLANSGIRHGREAMEIKWSNISFEKSQKDNMMLLPLLLQSEKAEKPPKSAVPLLSDITTLATLKRFLSVLKTAAHSFNQCH